jgi:hypothetical protein
MRGPLRATKRITWTGWHSLDRSARCTRSRRGLTREYCLTLRCAPLRVRCRLLPPTASVQVTIEARDAVESGHDRSILSFATRGDAEKAGALTIDKRTSHYPDARPKRIQHGQAPLGQHHPSRTL